jgi:hypothetical protein
MTNYSIAGSSGTTGLSQLTAPAGGDKIPVVDVSDTTTAPAGSAGSDKYMTVATLGQAVTATVNAVRDFGADPTGGSDTWTQIQTALLSFGTLTSWAEGNGGIVDLGEGFFTVSKPLVVPSGVKLRGVGPGGTLLRVITGSNCDVIQAAQYNSTAQATLLGGLVPGLTAANMRNAFYWGVEGMYLHGEAFSTPAAGYFHGINTTLNPATSAAPNDPDFDPIPTLRDLIVTGMTGDGIFHVGRSGALIERVLSQYHNGVGFTPSFDTTLIDCLANQCGAGFYLNHSSVVASGCKSYNNIDQTWVSGNSYSPGNVCVSAGAMYFCILAVTSATAPASDATHWTHLTAATAPQANGWGIYWDTGCGEHTWTAVDCQENSKGDYYFKGANTGGITVVGSSADVNFNNGQPAWSSGNASHYASVTFDGCSGVTAIINSSQQASGAGIICTSLNSPGSNTLIATTDLTETALFNGGTPGFALVNGVVQSVLAVKAGTDTSGTATASTPSLTSTVAAQLSTTQDVMLYISTKTAGATLAVSIGSTSSVTTTPVASHTSPLGEFIALRIPKGWFVKLTYTSADVTLTQVTC